MIGRKPISSISDPDAEQARAAEILRLDDKRRAALLAADFAALDEIFTDDLTHVHASGRVDTKQSLFEGMRNEFDFLEIIRHSLQIRCGDNVTIMTTHMTHKMLLKATGATLDLALMITQVWVPVAHGWKQAAFHATRLPPAK